MNSTFWITILILLIVSTLLAVPGLILSILALVQLLAIQQSKTTITSTASSLSRWNTQGLTVAGVTSVPGAANNQLRTPYHLVLDSTGALYIGDSDNHRVQKYLSGSTTGITVAGQSGTAGNGLGQLNNPTGIAIDGSNNLYIVDTNNHRVQYWPNGGSAGTTITNPGLSGPYGITRDESSGAIYVSNSGAHQIYRYSSGSLVATIVAGSGTAGTSNTQLSDPKGLYYDSSSGSLLIANYGANNIVRWQIGSNTWTIAAGDPFGLPGSSSTLLRNPIGVTLDSDGNMYVADTFNHRIQFFPAGQTIGRTIAGVTGLSGNNATLLSLPFSVALDHQNNLYVADRGNDRVQIFSRL